MRLFFAFLLSFAVSTALYSQTPAPLDYYGLNFANAQLKLANVDVSTGNLNLISAAATSPDMFQSGVSDIDGPGGKYFYIRGGQVYTVDLQSGNVLHSPSITCNSQPLFANAPITNIAYNWVDSTIYGLHFYNSELRLASLDPISGVMTIISPAPTSPDQFASGVSDLDPFNRRYFYVRANRLYTVNLDNGLVTSQNQLTNPNGAVSPITNIGYNHITGKIYGLNYVGGTWPALGELRLAEVDPTNGNVNLISQNMISPDLFQSGVSDLNPVNNTYTYVRGNGSNTQQIVTVDLATGSVLYSPNLQNPNGAVSPITNIACPYKEGSIPKPEANFQFDLNGFDLDLRDISPYAATFTWDFGDGVTHTAQHPNHTYSQPGNYTLRLIVSNQAGADTLYHNVTIEVPTSAEAALDKEWILSPNPSNGNVRLIAPSDLDPTNIQLTVTDLQGKLVWGQSEGILAGVNALQLEGLANGVYFLRIQEGEQFGFKRLVIKR